MYLRGKGWNVSTCGLSVGSEIFLGGTAGVSYSKSLLSKYGTPLPWIRSNSIILMFRKLQELKEKGFIEEKEEVRECQFIAFILKSTLIIFPIIMILTITATLFFK